MGDALESAGGAVPVPSGWGGLVGTGTDQTGRESRDPGLL